MPIDAVSAFNNNNRGIIVNLWHSLKNMDVGNARDDATLLSRHRRHLTSMSKKMTSPREILRRCSHGRKKVVKKSREWIV